MLAFFLFMSAFFHIEPYRFQWIEIQRSSPDENQLLQTRNPNGESGEEDRWN